MLRTVLAGAWGVHAGNEFAGNPAAWSGAHIVSGLLGALVVLLLCDAWDYVVARQKGSA